MASGHHKAARQRDWSTPLLRLAAPALVATLVTGTVVGAAVAWPEQPATSVAAISRPMASFDTEPLPGSRVEVISRSAPRVSLSPKPEPTPEPKTEKPTPTPEPETETLSDSDIVDHLFLTTALNVWTGPGEDYTLLEVLPAGTKVPVTGEVVDGAWAEISYDGLSRWVNADYLVEEKPQPEEEEAEARVAGISSAPCPSGSDVESGLTSDAVLVHRAVCAAFPEITTYGGLRSDGEHGQGLALDIMVSGSLGDQVAEYLRANAGSLGISYLIWSQQIWTVERSSEGWRYMEDRGSTTANHYDHVHVTVYGNSAG
ncbi:MAG TPA: SH3 domain-containing protein [Nocardioidaceae bacterium]|nr:SH3 domain-containing protein [Nocardioidaceae bacterium]